MIINCQFIGYHKKYGSKIILIFFVFFIIFYIHYFIISETSDSLRSQNNLVIFWSLLTIFVIFLIIRLVKFNLTSFLVIFSLGIFTYFPAAALLNLILSESAIDYNLWMTADLAQLSAFVGLIGFYLGAAFHKMNIKSRSLTPMIHNVVEFTFPSAFTNGFLVSFLAVVALLKLSLGTYYHGSTGLYQFDNAIYNNLFRWISSIGYIGIFFQLGKWLVSKKQRDFILLVIFLSIAIGIFLPTGSRTAAIGFLPLILLLYSRWEKNRLRLFLLSGGALFIIVIIIVSGQLVRASNTTIGKSSTISGAFSLYSSTVIEQSSTAFEENTMTDFVARLSDFRAVGRVIDWTPDRLPYRWLDGVDTWWQIAVPKFLRPVENLINFQDGAVQVVRYGIYGGGSSPIMIFGDLFSRFGWIGLFLGMFFLGAILCGLDFYFHNKGPAFRLALWVLISPLIYNFATSTLLVVVTSLTRDLLIVFIISKLIIKFTLLRSNLVNIRKL